jgi:hypothetical protein
MEDTTRNIDPSTDELARDRESGEALPGNQENQQSESEIKTGGGLTGKEREKVVEANKSGRGEIIPAVQVKSKRGGKRPGSGRPRKETYLQKHTVASRRASVEMQMRIVRQTPALLNSQIALAKGVSYLLRVDIIGGKQKTSIVKDKLEIVAFFDGLLENTDERTYYHITTDKPNLQAITDLMDRAYGKARQTVGLDGGEGKPIMLENYERAKRALVGAGVVVV